MSEYLSYFQIIVSVLLIAAVLLQARGSGLSSIFGGEGNIYRTKRGLEKVIFIATIILAILFLTLAVVNLFISR